MTSINEEGSATNTNHNYPDDLWIDIRADLPSVQECYEYCAADPSCGAVASFVGITRDNFQSKKVLFLSYEAYESMARAVLRTICLEARRLFGVHRIAALHKIGECPVGHASVILVCASPHRKASLEATEYLIDELKARVPIWKREVYEGDEQSVWKENIEWHEGKSKRVMIKEGDR
ncbi:molybdopterin synthase [Fragilaria crotonensis]|nr:molybdopterin synthase [Fragilaria crotonensis]